MRILYTDAIKINDKDVEYSKINHDTSGNPRYMVHYSYINNDYAEALLISRKVGAVKSRSKYYSEYIILDTYSLGRDLKRIIGR